jgi:methylenetetrahydrofolate dehydrogenase (NADP+)/methenyltetrahydrofolate cyclohydrolase
MIVNGSIIKEALLEEMNPLAQEKKPRVCFVQFGDDAASTKFIGVKMKAAEQLGLVADVVTSGTQTTSEALSVLQEVIEKKYDGIVVQLPLPAGIDSTVVINAIPMEMDMDVLSIAALAAFAHGTSNRMPPVAAAVDVILKLYKVSLADKKIVIRGKGKLVGEPVSMLFDRTQTPYDIIDINTPLAEQQELLQQADIIVSGIGVPHSLTSDMIKEGVILIDAGTSEQNGKLAGDIDPTCASKASLYTPVPGGVGPITVACLFKNLFL